jgi:ParB family chromosome partitioning protein
MMVDIKHRSDSGGEVKITYRSLEQLDEICRRLSQR